MGFLLHGHKGRMHVTVDDHLTVSVSDVLREMGAKE